MLFIACDPSHTAQWLVSWSCAFAPGGVVVWSSITDFVIPSRVGARVLAVLAQQAGARSPVESILQFAPLLAVAFLAWMLLYRPERQRQLEAEKLRSAIKRNDHVVTASGIYGTVAAVDRDAGRVTLKIDESSNVKLDVTLASIARLIGEPSKQESSGD